MPTDNDLLALGDERFVSLTTFRRSGEPVSSPVWILREGDALFVTTPKGTGKLKRLRHSGRLELRPSSRRGAVAEGVQPVAGVGEILDDPATVEGFAQGFLAKYRLEYRIFMLIERLARSGNPGRVIIRITPA